MATSFKLNDGHAIPWIALGTGTALYGKDATNAVAQAVAGGFIHLDGAQMYKNEESLGAAIQQAGVPRNELFVTTKLATLPAGTSVVESLKESLGKLRLDYVDLFLIHVPTQHPDLPATWKGMEECKAAGLTRRSVCVPCQILLVHCSCRS
jgi:diketogulonate reductase-like aldo/keto reductase